MLFYSYFKTLVGKQVSEVVCCVSARRGPGCQPFTAQATAQLRYLHTQRLHSSNTCC